MPPVILIDTSVLVAFYNANDRYHTQSCQFFDRCISNLVTTTGCVTESMWLLAPDHRVQNLFLSHLSQQIYQCEPLIPQDFARILELNQQYADNQSLPRSLVPGHPTIHPSYNDRMQALERPTHDSRQRQTAPKQWRIALHLI